MYDIFDPISGEKGFFCSKSEKAVIDAILIDYQENQLVTTRSEESSGLNE